MVMVLTLVELVHRAFALKMAAGQDVRLFKLHQYSVDRGQANVHVLQDELAVHIFCGHVALCATLKKFKKFQPWQGGLEAKRLLEAIGWAFLLPHLLATLGLLFNQAGVGQAIAELAHQYLQLDSRLAACAAYALAMAGLTVVMGNAFAAFPVITAGLGIPLLIEQHDANPAVMAAIGMFCGYCGTLLTPMAANFNVVPVALLQLKDQYAVIKAQAPTALLLLCANIFLLDWLAF